MDACELTGLRRSRSFYMKFTSARSSQILFAAALLLVLYAALAYGIWVGLAQRVPGANDFYSRWVGARALFLHGANPYSDAVTREIQRGMYGRPALANEDQVAFAYPLYAAFIAAPFVMLPYAQAQSLWMALLILAVASGALALGRLSGVKSLRPLPLAALLLGVLLFYPAVRGIFLGQFALWSFFCLALALAAIDARNDLSAGALLALALVKPQPAILLVPVVLAWALYQRRWRIVEGAVGVLLALILAAMVWAPTWPLDFIQAVRRYADYEPVGPPVQTLGEWFAPALSAPFTFIVSGALLGWLVWRAVRTLGATWLDFQPTVHLAAIVTTLMAGRVGTPDQMILLIPWLCWLGAWWGRGRRAQALLVGLGLVILPWAVFLFTLRGNTEDVGMTLVLPFLTLAVFVVRGANRNALAPTPKLGNHAGLPLRN
jgi:Glycosyltransferase family 87